MATISPDPQMGDAQYNNGSGSESNSKSPLANLGFFKSLTEKKTTRDGQPAKRRGPKPDSKPALTRRQELNRQAQRTHRERKEMYIKHWNKKSFASKKHSPTRHESADAFAEENRRLKELLMAHGISYDINSPINGLGHIGSSTYGGSSSGSVSGYGPGSNSTGYTSPPNMPTHPRGSISGPASHQPQQSNSGIDYDQIGIDFVLTLERPCMDHMQFLMIRANGGGDNTDGANGTTNPHTNGVETESHLISGHALMATCPPESHVANHPEDQYPHQMPDIAMPDLLKLLDLSNRLPLDGEITPIMAWAMILQDQRFAGLSNDDFEAIKTGLLGKIRCYGFGAVLEEFEVRDALMAVFAGKGIGNGIST